MKLYQDEIKETMKKYFSDDIRILIGDFSILWNLYEKDLFKRAKEKYIESKGRKIRFFQEDIHYGILEIFKSKLSDTDIIKSINYNYILLQDFLDRQFIYFNASEIIDFFRVNDNDNSRKEVFNLFDNNGFKDNIENRLNLLLIIIYRVRNNMFHGSKNILKLEDEKILFIICCNIINMLLEPIENKISMYGRW